MEQFAPGFRNLRLLPGLGEGTQPLHRPFCRHADLRRLLELGQGRSEPLHSVEIRLVADPAADVVEGKLPHLTLDPRTVDGDGSHCLAKSLHQTQGGSATCWTPLSPTGINGLRG